MKILNSQALPASFFINSCCLPGLFSYTSATHYSKGFKQVACLLAGDGSHWCIGAVQHLCYEVNRRCHKHGIAYQSAIKLPIISRPPAPNKGKKLEIDELEKWSRFRLGSGNWQGNQTTVRVMQPVRLLVNDRKFPVGNSVFISYQTSQQ